LACIRFAWVLRALQGGARAFSGEVDAGSREENAPSEDRGWFTVKEGSSKQRSTVV
jgi:hypothetical protein